nr:CAP domain-containing protein [Streptomyces sp. NBC_00857]
MGRHRRSAAVPPADHSVGGTGGSHPEGAGRKRRIAKPVRTGLLGASAAMAVGAVAVASGLLPGGGQYTVGDSGNGGPVRADAAPELHTQGGASADPSRETSESPSRGSARTKGPTKSASATPTKPSATPSKESKEPTRSKSAAAPAKTRETDKSSAPSTPTKAPVPTKTQSTPSTAAPSADDSTSSMATEVLSLVNQERDKVGCSPLRADASLDKLAQDFSDDMAARGFFSHTDPDGNTPWDRADKAGVTGLGGENIARGQATAKAVMDSWMNSEGHRANILNCDYTRLGVGVHTGSGGPWWTQDFGF